MDGKNRLETSNSRPPTDQIELDSVPLLSSETMVQFAKSPRIGQMQHEDRNRAKLNRATYETMEQMAPFKTC